VCEKMAGAGGRGAGSGSRRNRFERRAKILPLDPAQPGFINIMIFQKYRNIENITIFFDTYGDIFDTFDIFKNAPIVRVRLFI